MYRQTNDGRRIKQADRAMALTTWIFIHVVGVFFGLKKVSEVSVLSLFMPWGLRFRSTPAIAKPVSIDASSGAAGKVWLVGAGPGDPELISVRALRLLRSAEVVIHDRLVAPELLAECASHAHLIDVGKRPGHHAVPQADIEALLIAQARAGRQVVRLKGGDPFIFGRGGEEMAALRTAGITFEVVPGITAAAGCAAAAGFPLTQRGVADSVCLATATHGDDHDDAHWSSLAADRRRTLVFYMGLSRLTHIQQRLTAYGLPGSTPAALIENGTTHCQRRVFCTLDDISAQATRHDLTSPCLLVIGEVVALAAEASPVACHSHSV